MIKNYNSLSLAILLTCPAMSYANVGSSAIWVAKKTAGIVFLGTAAVCTPDTIQGHHAGLPMGTILLASYSKGISLLTGKNILSNGTKSTIARAIGAGFLGNAAWRSLQVIKLNFNNLSMDDKAHLILTAATAWLTVDCALDIVRDVRNMVNKRGTKKELTNSASCEQIVKQ